MHPFFAPLTAQPLALLLTALSESSGKDSPSLDALGRLGGPDAQTVRERAQALLAMPREVRRPLMASEFQELLNEDRGGLEWIDPSWLLHQLRGETPRMVAVVLLGLPPVAMRAVLQRLPPGIRRALPAKSDLEAVEPTLLRGLQLNFAAHFTPMPNPRASGPREFSDVLFLPKEALYRLIRDLGLAELGQAFAAVEKMALVALTEKLAKDDAHALIEAMQNATKVAELAPKTARHFLTHVVVNFEETEQFLQKSGLWRLARAIHADGDAAIAAWRQRLPRWAGASFAELCRQAQAYFVEQGEQERSMLKDAILVRVVQLARGGTIAGNWGQNEVRFHDPAACAQALGDSGGEPS